MNTKLDLSVKNIDRSKLIELQESNNLYSYSKLCDKLNLSKTSGNSKIRQLRQLSSLCTYEKIGCKFRITEVLDNVAFDLFNERSIYVPYIELLLSDVFFESNIIDGENGERIKSYTKKDIIYLTNKEIMEICEMFNKNYKILLGKYSRHNISMVSQCYNIKEDSLYDFINKGYLRILYPIINSALQSMERRKSISINKGYKFYKNNKDFQPSYMYALETDTIGQIIFKQEGNILTELGVNKDYELFGSKQYLRNEFYNRCNDFVKKQSKENEYWKRYKWDFDGYYKCNAIILNNDRIDFNVPIIKKELKERVQERFSTSSTFIKLTGEEKELFIDMLLKKEGETKWKLKDDIKQMEQAIANEILNGTSL